jgi:putative glutamine amidotransferase
MPSPLIAVTSGRRPAGARIVDSVDADYGRAVAAAGGRPVLLPPSFAGGDPTGLDGILLSGGGDVGPPTYGAPASPECGGIDPERDAFEIALALSAIEAGIPVLGICRGCQVLNVALGGTLHQHLPDITGLDHLVPEPRHAPAHGVDVATGSELHWIVGTSALEVNSIHHQAIDVVAPGLQVVGRAPDGVVEAVEMRGRPVLAVQWHPESLGGSPPSRALFEWLVRAAALHGAGA